MSWNKKLSDKFSVSKGVRQGGVLCPFFALSTSMTFSWSCRGKVLGATGTNTSLVPFVMQTILLYSPPLLVLYE